MRRCSGRLDLPRRLRRRRRRSTTRTRGIRTTKTRWLRAGIRGQLLARVKSLQELSPVMKTLFHR